MTSTPSAAPESLLTDLQDVHAAMTAAQLKGETDVLIRSCQWLLKQVPRAMALIESQQREIERKDEALRRIASRAPGDFQFGIAQEALSPHP